MTTKVFGKPLNDSILTKDMELANVCNNYFINISTILELTLHVLTNTNVDLPSIIENYKNHLSITKIRSTWNSTCFQFVTVSQNDVKNVIKNLFNNKANLLGGIPGKILKLALESYLPKLTKLINDYFENRSFPDDLKLAKLYPFINSSNVFETLAFNQINNFLESKF